MQNSSIEEGAIICRLPSEAYEFVPSPDLIFSPGSKIPLRNIFSNQIYSEVEQEKLKRLKIEITKARLIIPPRWDDAELMRIIHGSGYKTRKAFKDLKESIETFNRLIPSDYRILFPKAFTLLVIFT